MKKQIIILTIIFEITSCNPIQTNNNDVNIHSDDKSKIEFQSKPKEERIDGERIPEIYCDTTEIEGKKYIGCNNSENHFFIISEKSDTIYKHDEWIFKTKILDFNNDGRNDFLLEYVTNVPNHNDLLLYDSRLKKFKKVENFYSFPTPTKIQKTGFYYSYQRSGCADSNWESDLFIIKDFKAIQIGNIEGIGCEGTGKTGIFISKIKGKEEEIVKEILREPGYYKDKFNFIKDYWAKNYNKFK